MTDYFIVQQDELYHHGIKGQRWGVRRFQNEDGTLTSKGQARLGFGKAEKRAIGAAVGAGTGAATGAALATVRNVNNKKKMANFHKSFMTYQDRINIRDDGTVVNEILRKTDRAKFKKEYATNKNYRKFIDESLKENKDFYKERLDKIKSVEKHFGSNKEKIYDHLADYKYEDARLHMVGMKGKETYIQSEMSKTISSIDNMSAKSLARQNAGKAAVAAVAAVGIGYVGYKAYQHHKQKKEANE